MTPLEAARRHLTKAQEFLAEANSALASGRATVATSNAVIAGINAKDAICLVLVGKTAEADEGGQAHVRLRDTGEVPQCRRAVISGAGETLLRFTMEQASQTWHLADPTRWQTPGRPSAAVESR